uniref:Putative secreted protein n=1 Tax=Anopheles marajoara TaxID=58244 RepID=A0A2M4CB55_9DIPT
MCLGALWPLSSLFVSVLFRFPIRSFTLTRRSLPSAAACGYWGRPVFMRLPPQTAGPSESSEYDCLRFSRLKAFPLCSRSFSL